ncbi:unnamed protein product [Ophioblennius macclurei]
MVAEQCQVNEVADLTGLSKGSADLDIKILVEYTEQIISGEMDPSVLCVEHCNMNIDKSEPCTFCNGHADSYEQHSASNRFFEPDLALFDCDTWGLSQPFDERALYCECFKPYKSPEHCANHSLASKCSPCHEHCAGHLQLFQQCKPSDQQLESSDFEPNELEVNSDSFSQYEMSDLIPGCTKHPEVQQKEPYECSDSEPDTSTGDSGQSEMSASTPNLSNSVESLDCVAEDCEYDEIQNNEPLNDDESSYETEQGEEEASNEESISFSEETSVDVDYDNVEYAPLVDDDCNAYLCAEDDPIQYGTVDMLTDPSKFYEYEDPEITADYDHSQDSRSEFCAEEDGTSDYSSGETRSSQTCSDGSTTSDPCSESSGDSEKGTQEDSSDEQWDSFEDDEELHKINESNADVEKKAVADIVIEDYFELFDRADHYDLMFAQKQRYVSCFDGGDIHDRLYLEEAALRRNIEKVRKFEETVEENNVQDTEVCSEDAHDTDEDDSSQRDESCYSEDQSGSSLAGDEADEDESETQENSEEAEDDEASFDGEGCTFDDDVSKLCEEETASCPSSASEDSTYAPFAKEISVEGDAYEDEIYSSLNDKIEQIETSRIDDQEKPMDKVLIACSEMEPYCSLLDIEQMGELCESGVEDYYSYCVLGKQSFVNQEFLTEGRLYRQKLNEKAEKNDELQVAKIYPRRSATFQFINVIDLNSQTAESEDEYKIEEVTRQVELPSDIIHSVVSENTKISGRDVQTEGTEEVEASEQSGDSEEEQTDDESYDTCDCEYCIPPTEQIPTEPLLPQLPSNASGKICVVIDLDETLVHSSFKPVNNADFTIPVEIDGTVHQVYVLKRPHVDEFLKRMGEMFECVLFTASLSKYADPVSDLLDKHGAFQSRLFRESCVFHKGNYVKDLSRLGRDLNKVIIIDNSPASYVFHPENAVAVVSWFDDVSDTELMDLIPFFERLSKVDDVYDLLSHQRTSS